MLTCCMRSEFRWDARITERRSLALDADGAALVLVVLLLEGALDNILVSLLRRDMMMMDGWMDGVVMDGVVME